MSSEHRIFLVDVFTQRPYSGNPLAVIASDEPLPTATMQKIAAEMNFSETTFVATTPDTDGGYALRVFTPVREIAFTGHPILGTAWVVRHSLLADSRDQINLNLNLAQVPVQFEVDEGGAELCWFEAPPMMPGEIIEASAIAPILGLSEQDINTELPVQVVSSGTAAIIVPVCNLDALGRGRLDLNAFAPLAGAGHPPLVYLYCPEASQPGNDIAARFFFEANEVREDPATGNGAAFLGAYLLKHEMPDNGKIELRIEQGYALGRPSRIHLQACRLKTGERIRVGGAVVATVAGVLIDPGRFD